jgi:protein-S-isoprenylcysteine O-methyltransferase Ste14
LPDAKVVLLVLVTATLFLVSAALGWGGWSGLFAHPARVGACLVVVFSSLAALFAGINLGEERDVARRLWMILPFTLLIVAQAWFPAYADRHDLWTLDGDTIRYVGLVLLVVGAVLRVGPMFALGPRFKLPLAKQEEHRLVTTGFYRHLRHPSYLGAMLGGVGWFLVFRCWIGALLFLLLIPLGMRLIRAEESQLLSEFGDEYAAYQKRTWRLVPFVY